MGTSKELFITQREFELMEMSSRDLKKEATKQANLLLEENQAEEIYSKTARLSKYLDEFNKAIKPHINQLETFNNVEFSEGQRVSPNFKEDAEWLDLHTKLKEREELLKMRIKLGKEIYDSEGVEVPLISSTTTSFIKANIK